MWEHNFTTPLDRSYCGYGSTHMNSLLYSFSKHYLYFRPRKISQVQGLMFILRFNDDVKHIISYKSIVKYGPEDRRNVKTKDKYRRSYLCCSTILTDLLLIRIKIMFIERQNQTIYKLSCLNEFTVYYLFRIYRELVPITERVSAIGVAKASRVRGATYKLVQDLRIHLPPPSHQLFL